MNSSAEFTSNTTAATRPEVSIMGPVTIATIEGLYGDPSQEIPRLSDEALATITAFLVANDCGMIAGATSGNPDMTIGETLKLSRANLSSEILAAKFLGPYIDGLTSHSDNEVAGSADGANRRSSYYPHGVGIWVTRISAILA